MVSAGAVDTHWLAAAAACQVCEFVAVKAPVNLFRFDVSLVVLCVRFVVEGDHDVRG